MNDEKKLSFILPVALKEPKSKHTWRNEVGNGSIPICLRMMLLSFTAMFNQRDLKEFLLVCPPHDVEGVASILGSITSDPRYKILSELDICPEITEMINKGKNKISGWVIQQLIKLAIFEHISSPYYVTLDSDIICIKPCSYDCLIHNSRAIANVETRQDYERIYTKRFAKNEEKIKNQRYARSRKILHYDRYNTFVGTFYGETPVIMHNESVKALTDYLSNQYDLPWSAVLAKKRSWTEYALYFQFLEMQNSINLIYETAGCNSVLNLERSVWQENKHYQRQRLYDASHFFKDNKKVGGGYFVAIQSWLPVESWLPEQFSNLGEFYQEFEHWLHSALFY